MTSNAALGQVGNRWGLTSHASEGQAFILSTGDKRTGWVNWEKVFNSPSPLDRWENMLTSETVRHGANWYYWSSTIANRIITV